MKRKLFGLMIFVAFEVSAQDTVTLKLQDALELAISNNKEIVIANLDYENAIAKFNETNAVFLPQVNVSYTAMRTNNPLNAFGSKLQQQSVSPSDFNPELLNNPSPTHNFTTNAELNQPLINLDLMYQRAAAKQQIEVYYFKTKRTKEFLRFEVQKAYGQLQLSQQAEAVLEEGLLTMNSILKSSKDYFEKGYILKPDLLRVQVELASMESKLAEAKSNVRNASDYISLLIGVKSGPIYLVGPLEKASNEENIQTNISDARADFSAVKAALRAQEIMITSEKMSRLPKLNAFANYMFNDKSAFGFGSNSYLVGAQFSWRLFNGMASRYRMVEQRLTHARIEQELDYQKQQSQLELNKTLRHLQDIQFALQQYGTSVDQATEALRILQNRFQQGLVSTSNLLQSQSTLSEQKLLLSEAVCSYNTTLAYFKFLTSGSETNK
jgi:outer membrane protein TolC